MARKVRTHVIAPDSPTSGLAPKHLTKQEFAKRIYNLMMVRGWNQSELARQAGLNRDAISTYMNGRALPTPPKLKALANALNVGPDELLPNHTESAIDQDMPAFEMRVSTSSSDQAWLRVNRLVSVVTAVKIAELLQGDDVLNRAGSGAKAALQPVED